MLLGAAPGRAATVLIVRPTNSPPVMVETLVRIHGELTSAGFATEIVDGPLADGADGRLSRGGLEQLAVRRGADAVVAIVGDQSPDSVEVWVIDKVTGKSVVRRVPFEPRAARAPETLAIRAIELLRSSFLEIDLAARERQGGKLAEPPPAVVEFVEKERLVLHPERYSVAVGGAAMMSLDGVGPAMLPTVELAWALSPWLALQAALAGLGTRPTVGGQAGSSQVTQGYGLLGGSLRFREGARLRPFVALAVGALFTSVDGRADSPNLGRSAAQWSLLVDGGLGAALRLPNRFYLSLAGHAQFAEPYVAVRFLDQVVATAARPNLLLALTLGAWL
jgi:hypothetical protein